MNIIELSSLCKQYKVLNRHEGLKGAFKDLFSKDYKIVKAVDNISLEIKAGEILGFVGPNGAGKSTTIKMMTGVLEPSSGHLEINNCTPYKNRKHYVKNIGVVFGQRTQLWWELPVIESFKLLKEIYQIDSKVYEENISMFNDLVNLKELHLTPVRFLSLGQRMLCDIAASFLHNPKIIFLDEPTIGLDVSIKSKIRSVIKRLNEERKTTILLTTHDISDIEALCKRIIIIDKGSIIYDGSIQTINKIFGAYRTLKVDINDSKENLFEIVNQYFKCKNAIPVDEHEDGWISITVNQEEVPLLNILNFIMGKYSVKDIKIEEIETESIIKKIYEGELK